MKFNSGDFARENDRRLSSEGYPGILLDAGAREVKGSEHVLDVGAGSGFFSVPLAAMGYSVEAVEPSEEMIKILRKKLDPFSFGRIRISPTDWESWEGSTVDSLLCAHSLYPMRDTAFALSKMKRSSRRVILLVRADEGNAGMSQLLRAQLKRNNFRDRFFSKTETLLRELDFAYEVRFVEQTRLTVFFNLDDEARYYCGHLGLEETDFPEVKNILAAHSVAAGAHYEYVSLYRDAVITF